MAGPEGTAPSSSVLETDALLLSYEPFASIAHVFYFLGTPRLSGVSVQKLTPSVSVKRCSAMVS